MAKLDKLLKALEIKALGNEITTTKEETLINDKGEQNGKKITKTTIKNDIDTSACIKLIDIELKKQESEKERLQSMSDEELIAMAKKLARELSII